jgi:thioredoxin 2
LAAIFSAACPHCDQANNIPNDATARQARCGSCDGAMFDGRPIDVDPGRFAKHIAVSQIPVLAMFWLPTRQTIHIDLAEYAARFEPRIRFLTINMEDHYDLGESHQVRGVPSMALFSGGRLVDRKVGKPHRPPPALGAPERPDPLVVWLEEHARASPAA